MHFSFVCILWKNFSEYLCLSEKISEYVSGGQFDRADSLESYRSKIAETVHSLYEILESLSPEFNPESDSAAFEKIAAFSKSIGLTLCGIVEDPTSPFTAFCLK